MSLLDQTGEFVRPLFTRLFFARVVGGACELAGFLGFAEEELDHNCFVGGCCERFEGGGGGGVDFLGGEVGDCCERVDFTNRGFGVVDVEVGEGRVAGAAVETATG